MEQKTLAAGIIAIAKDTGKILLVKRSALCPQPHTWATVGGKNDPADENLKVTAVREFKEEVQPNIKYEIITKPFFINKMPKLEFYSFVGFFETEFIPVLNDENDEYKWYDLDALPKNLLSGCQIMFNEKKNALKELIKRFQQN